MEQQTNLRTCANCACFARVKPDGKIVEDDPEAQTVCRRSPPGARQVSVDVPVLNNGRPVMDAKGAPRVQRMLAYQFGFQPTAPELLCYDGWRPLGTLPGDNHQFVRVLPLVAELTRGNSKVAQKIASAILDDMMQTHSKCSPPESIK
jgi:hypothetical protein